MPTGESSKDFGERLISSSISDPTVSQKWIILMCLSPNRIFNLQQRRPMTQHRISHGISRRIIEAVLHEDIIF